MERNLILLSLKLLVRKNTKLIDDYFNYTKTYIGNILALGKNSFYYVLIKSVWVIGKLESFNKYKISEEVEIRPISKGKDLILTDD